jgi:hypothetical protein
MRLNKPQKDACKTGIVSMPVRTAKTLVIGDFVDLLEGKFIALHIPNYHPQESAEQIGQQILKYPAFERYLRAPDIGIQRTGMTFFELVENFGSPVSCCDIATAKTVRTFLISETLDSTPFLP